MARFDNRPPQVREPEVRINQRIRAVRVRVVDSEGQHGIMSIEEALQLASVRGLDLVEIAPNADPPVCKIIDFGKFRYEQQKREKEQRKKQQGGELKEIRFRPGTDDHDFAFKTKHAREFLSEGHKVKAWVQFRGRDIVYKERGEVVLKQFIEALADVSKLDQPPTMEGKRMSVLLAPDAKKKK